MSTKRKKKLNEKLYKKINKNQKTKTQSWRWWVAFDSLVVLWIGQVTEWKKKEKKKEKDFWVVLENEGEDVFSKKKKE